MRIEKIHLKNIGPFKEETLVFKPIQNNDKKGEVHILTGPNGSGKSTILHALVSALIYKNASVNVIDNKIEKKFHSYSNFPKIEVFNSYEEKFVLTKEKHKLFIEKIDGKKLENKIGFREYKNMVGSRNASRDLHYACFAYSGYRTFTAQSIETIKEISGNPLKEALIFNKVAKNVVSQWLANTIAKEAIAFRQKDEKTAHNYEQSIQKIEQIIGELIKQEVKFELQTKPINIVLNQNGKLLDFDVLPDGLKSIISWIGDLLMRLDRLPWENDASIFERKILLFLDEIEVHLHPKWQMKILPIVQNLFPNAQIFISTHSPFVVNSIDDAWVYKLSIDKNGVSSCSNVFTSETGKSYNYVLNEIFDIEERFGLDTEKKLNEFYVYRTQLLENKIINETKFKQVINKLLAENSTEIQQIVGHELRQIKRITKKDFVYDEN